VSALAVPRPRPRYLANGPEIAGTGGALIKSITKFADGPEGMRKAVRELVDLGVDQIKLSMTGEEITGTQHAEDTYFSDEECAAAVTDAHRRGKRVCAHARSAESVKMCVRNHVDIIYRAPRDAPPRHSGPARRRLRLRLDSPRHLRPRPPALRRTARLHPMEAILSATAQGGQIMLRPGELGKVQPSYLADLLLVDGNPLDDITILQDHDKLNYIMKDGRFHSEPGDHDAPPPSRDELVTTSTQAVFEQRP